MSADNKWTAWLERVFPVQQRVLITVWCFCVVAFSTTIRLLTSVSILKMINFPSNFTQDPTFDYCWTTTCDSEDQARVEEKQFDWDDRHVGYIFAAFSIGYSIIQVPAGILVNLFSEKPVWLSGMLVGSIFTILVPLASNSNGFEYLFIIRALTGLFLGAVFSSMNSLLTKWFPTDELWIASGMVYSGVPFGGLISVLFGGLIMYHTNKWSSMFKIFGIAGIVLSIIFCFLIYGSPEKHPCLTQSEKEFITTNVVRPDIRISEIPWRALLSNSAIIGLSLVRAGQDFGFNILMNYFPIYYANILCLTVVETTFYTAIPFLCAFVFTILSALLADHLEKRGISPTSVRKVYSGFSSVLAAVFLVGAAFFNCDKFGVLFSFCITMCGMGFYLSGICTNELMISRTFCGTISGITNAASGVASIIGPLFVGYLVKTRSLTEWRVMMWVIFIIFNISTIPYMVWGSGNDQQFEANVETLSGDQMEQRKIQKQTKISRCIFL